MTRIVSAPASLDATTRERLDELLTGSSRTFALTIPLLPEPTRLEVTLAYLLFRVADTLEDATRWDATRRQEELEALARLFETPSAARAVEMAAGWRADPPLDHAGYLELLSELPLVLAASQSLTPASWAIIARHSARTTRGMATFVARAGEGPLRLRDLADLRAYCYTVAGIVGEMLTELFLLGRQQLAGIATELRADASAFGEGLQLVNILKDADADAEEGRRFLPVGADRAGIFEMAFDGLDKASRYCARLEAAGAERGLLASIALPIVLARATLQRVQRLGPGAKLGRVQVAGLLARLHGAIAMGRLAEFVTEKTPAVQT
ncbi:MAG: squalene/phytoene synthase family protein [Cytophagaceae bacterium]|nr:squalene/phytoene synthase family protein [Gemmatimonadaceae bacterium]